MKENIPASVLTSDGRSIVSRQQVFTVESATDGGVTLIAGARAQVRLDRVGALKLAHAVVVAVQEGLLRELPPGVRAHRDDSGDLHCPCGNAGGYGLWPCLDDGTEVEPVTGGPWQGLYCCGRCNKIINYYTCEIVGVRQTV